ncbi:MAG: Probable Co/Zn/Cd efflux system membrane fusion protein, partial [uncultured Nocardioides sp.]
AEPLSAHHQGPGRCHHPRRRRLRRRHGLPGVVRLLQRTDPQLRQRLVDRLGQPDRRRQRLGALPGQQHGAGRHRLQVPQGHRDGVRAQHGQGLQRQPRPVHERPGEPGPHHDQGRHRRLLRRLLRVHRGEHPDHQRPALPARDGEQLRRRHRWLGDPGGDVPQDLPAHLEVRHDGHDPVADRPAAGHPHRHRHAVGDAQQL